MIHSPGPWKFRGSTLVDANGMPLYREVANSRELTIAQNDGNRRLLEAGPDLLRLVQSLTVMRINHDGTVNIGPVGWAQLQAKVKELEGLS